MAGAIRQFLSSDHARLDALLRRALERPGDVDLDLYGAFRAGLLRHIALEEKILLPAARAARNGDPLPLARRLRVDHGAITSLLVPSPSHEIAAEIRSILGPHNAAEEDDRGLYDACDALLAGREAEILDRMRAYPDVKVAPYKDGPAVLRTAESALAASARQFARSEPRLPRATGSTAGAALVGSGAPDPLSGGTMNSIPEDLHRRILEGSPDAVLVSDRDGKVRYWNGAATRIFGFAPSEALGFSMDLIVPERLRSRHWAGWETVMKTGVSRYGEGQLLAVPALHKDGRQLSIEFSIQLLKDAAGQVEWVVAVIRDVTERFAREKALRAQLKALEGR